MNLIDSIINFYGYLTNGTLLLTPVRRLIRKVADLVIPYKLKSEEKKVGESRIYNCLNGKRIIVSFTSFPARIDRVYIVVMCMMRQTVRPDKIIIWLSKEQFNGVAVPESLTKLVGDVLEIRMVDKDFRSHKKYCYAFKEFKDDIVVLIDDDIYYPSTMIESLVRGLESHPQSVICQYGSLMKYNDDGTLPSYITWWKEKRESCFSNDFFFGTGGGSLFLPNRIDKTILDTELAIKLAPFADDIWVNALVRLSGLSIFKVECGLLLQMSEQQKTALKKQNLYGGQNDEQFKSVINYFVNERGVNPFEKRAN